MKIFLKYNYNLKDPTIYKVKNNIKVKDERTRYLLCPIYKIEELEEIYQLLEQEHLQKYFYKINKNIDGQLYSTYKETNYVLLTTSNNIRTSTKPLVIQRNISGEIIKSNWKELWVKKKEYYSQIIEQSHQDEQAQILYDYYNTMAETAISYLPNVEQINKRQIITHRIFKQSELYKQLNLIVDIEERELAEKIRESILNKSIELNKLNDFFVSFSKNINLELVYARLLFPNYYYDGLLKSSIDNTAFNILIGDMTFYEAKLKELYKIFNKVQNIKKVDWL